MKVYGNPGKGYDQWNRIVTNSNKNNICTTSFRQWNLEVSTLSSNRPGETPSSASCYLGDLGQVTSKLCASSPHLKDGHHNSIYLMGLLEVSKTVCVRC